MITPQRRDRITLTIYPVGCALWLILVLLVVILLNWLATR